jgi:hypothetical protein
MPKRIVRKSLLSAMVAIIGGTAVAQSPPVAPMPRPVALMPAPVAPSLPPKVLLPETRLIVSTPDGRQWYVTPGQTEQQVFVKCLIMEMPRIVWERHTAGLPRGGEGPTAPITLDEAKVMSLVRAMKADPAGMDVLGYPQMLLANNQSGICQVRQGLPVAAMSVDRDGFKTQGIEFAAVGLTLRVTPKVLADGTRVKVQVEFQHTRRSPADVNIRNGVVSPAFDSQTVQTTQIVADGKTTILPVGGTDEIVRVVAMTPHVCPPGLTLNPHSKPHTPIQMTTKVFNVTDLVTPIPGCCLESGTVKDIRTNGELLVKLVTSLCHPSAWKGMGGDGSAEFYAIGGVLVVNQTPEVIREVEAVLTSLRKLQEIYVTTEIRVVTVPFGFCAEQKIFACEQPAAGGPIAMLDDGRMAAVLAAAQADRRINAMQAPKLTQLNGQKNTIVVGEMRMVTTGVEIKVVNGQTVAEPKTEEMWTPQGDMASCGLNFTLQSLICEDQRSVRLAVQGVITSNTGPTELIPVTMPGNDNTPPHTIHIEKPNLSRLCVERIATVPSGRTMAFLAGTRPKPTTESCRCDRQSAREEVLVLITPRVVRTTEEPAAVQMVVHREAAPAPRPVCCAEPCMECRPAVNPQVAELVAAYRKACAEGRTEAAAALAVQALALDPMCFAAMK